MTTTWMGRLIRSSMTSTACRGCRASNFTSNSASIGAALAAHNNSTLELYGSHLQHNNASEDGGAVLVVENAQVRQRAALRPRLWHATASHRTSFLPDEKCSSGMYASNSSGCAYLLAAEANACWCSLTCLNAGHVRVPCHPSASVCMQLTMHNSSFLANIAGNRAGAILLGGSGRAVIWQVFGFDFSSKAWLCCQFGISMFAAVRCWSALLAVTRLLLLVTWYV